METGFKNTDMLNNSIIGVTIFLIHYPLLRIKEDIFTRIYQPIIGESNNIPGSAPDNRARESDKIHGYIRSKTEGIGNGNDIQYLQKRIGTDSMDIFLPGT